MEIQQKQTTSKDKNIQAMTDNQQKVSFITHTIQKVLLGKTFSNPRFGKSLIKRQTKVQLRFNSTIRPSTGFALISFEISADS